MLQTHEQLERRIATGLRRTYDPAGYSIRIHNMQVMLGRLAKVNVEFMLRIAEANSIKSEEGTGSQIFESNVDADNSGDTIMGSPSNIDSDPDNSDNNMPKTVTPLERLKLDEVARKKSVLDQKKANVTALGESLNRGIFENNLRVSAKIAKDKLALDQKRAAGQAAAGQAADDGAAGDGAADDQVATGQSAPSQAPDDGAACDGAADDQVATCQSAPSQAADDGAADDGAAEDQAPTGQAANDGAVFTLTIASHPYKRHQIAQDYNRAEGSERKGLPRRISQNLSDMDFVGSPNPTTSTSSPLKLSPYSPWNQASSLPLDSGPGSPLFPAPGSSIFHKRKVSDSLLGKFGNPQNLEQLRVSLTQRGVLDISDPEDGVQSTINRICGAYRHLILVKINKGVGYRIDLKQISEDSVIRMLVSLFSLNIEVGRTHMTILFRVTRKANFFNNAPDSSDDDMRRRIKDTGPEFQKLITSLNSSNSCELKSILHDSLTMYYDADLSNDFAEACALYTKDRLKLDRTYATIMGKKLVMTTGITIASHVKDMVAQACFRGAVDKAKVTLKLKEGKIFSTLRKACGAGIFVLFHKGMFTKTA
jgi:hypothetical protein